MTIIIGAGLSGLVTGYLLKKEGIPFKILEARNRVGGRINTFYGENMAPVEMGATWFTPQHKYLIKLLEELKIDFFKQSIDNTVFYESSSNSPAQLVQIPNQGNSYRISGGTSCLINALFKRLDQNDIMINQSVKHIINNENSVQVKAKNAFESNTVVLAIPPKLWAKNIEFTPQLPINLISVAKQTQTWMEDSIKVAITYNKPFWENEDLPSTLFSNAGPIVELYDHTNHEKSKFALCGFMDSSLKNLTTHARRESVNLQLKNIFGVRALEYTNYKECIWNYEENTYVPSDTILLPHQNNGNPIFNNTYFGNKLYISSSESALEFPGYMEGAVYSANTIVEKIKNAQQGA